MLGAARELCGGRLVMCHEGGYRRPTFPRGLAIMEELSGVRPTSGPAPRLLASFGGQDLQPHQDAVIQQAVKLATAVHAHK
jgi:hypothetical protein